MLLIRAVMMRRHATQPSASLQSPPACSGSVESTKPLYVMQCAHHSCTRVFMACAVLIASQVYGSGTGDEELLLHVMNAARAPLWLLSKPWLQQGTCCDASQAA
jgi:hypothetical protein